MKRVLEVKPKKPVAAHVQDHGDDADGLVKSPRVGARDLRSGLFFPNGLGRSLSFSGLEFSHGRGSISWQSRPWVLESDPRSSDLGPASL